MSRFDFLGLGAIRGAGQLVRVKTEATVGAMVRKSARKPIWARVVVVAWLAAGAGGCGVYLHDDTLQKQTDGALSTYKAANVSAAVKATLDAQTQFDKQLLDSAIAQDTAFREAELADLIAGRNLPPADATKKGSPPLTAIGALKYRIHNRLTDLGAQGQNLADWQFRHEKVTDAQVSYDNQRKVIAIDAGNYTRAGGKGFESCDKPFTVPTGLSEPAASAARKLTEDCDGLEKAKEGVDRANKPLNGVLKKGLIADVDQTLTAVTKQIAADQQAANEAAMTLKEAQLGVDTAKSEQTLDTEVVAVLKKVDGYLDAADKVAGNLGESRYSPGAALEAIKFRKTNLCDVLAANAGRSCSGATPSSAATAVNNAIGGVVSGVAKLTGIDNPPDTGTLAVAFAYQTGLEAVARTQLNGLQMQQTLLKNEEDALSQEVELLLAAQAALSQLSAKCDGKALGAVMLNKGCADAELDAIAEALAAYNLSWVKGRTAASVDETKRLQLGYMTTLQVAQANATARDYVIATTLTALDAYGQGGVPPATIASFLQAIAQGVIAKGVN